MKAMVLHEPGKPFVLEERPIPEPKKNEAVAKVLACGSGLTIQHTVAGRIQSNFPIVIGHEITAEITEIGPEVNSLSVGDPVTAFYYLTCGDCKWCRINRETLCDNLNGQIGRHIDGGYAEYIKLPARNFIKLPEKLDYIKNPAEIGIITDAIATPYKVIRHAEISPMENIAIIGAGAIGVEFAYFYNAFGAKVSIIEAQDHLLPSEDLDISKALEKSFEAQKINLNLSAKVESVSVKNKVEIDLKDKMIKADCVLVAIGVQGNIEGLFSENLDLDINKGFISTNEFMQTKYENIYAIGDIAGPPWLAHVASAEGILAVEHFSKKDVQGIDYGNIPGCTYCKPEIASIGLTEREAIDKGHDISIGSFPLSASGKAMAVSSTEGFVKIIYDEKYGELLGFHMIGENATELISEIAVARKLEATNDELLKIIHPHPTISESIVEATASSKGESIHI